MDLALVQQMVIGQSKMEEYMRITMEAKDGGEDKG